MAIFIFVVFHIKVRG